MKKFVLPLDKKNQRPVTKLYGVNTIVDTGAVIPTFSIPTYILERTFHGEKILDNATIGGFGGKSTGCIYALKNFKVGDMVFEHLEVFVPDNPVTKYPFLLSATMFYGTDYDINTITGEMTVNIPYNMSLNKDFRIQELNGELYVQVDGILLQDSVECDIDFSQFEFDLD